MITEVAGIPSELACGQASFVPHSKDLVFVGVPPDPNTLGRIYCTPIVATAIIIIAAAVVRTDRHDRLQSHVAHLPRASGKRCATNLFDHRPRRLCRSLRYGQSRWPIDRVLYEHQRVHAWFGRELARDSLERCRGSTCGSHANCNRASGAERWRALVPRTLCRHRGRESMARQRTLCRYEHLALTVRTTCACTHQLYLALTFSLHRTRVLALNVTSGAHATLSGLPRGSATVLAVQPATSGEKSAAVVVTVSTPISSTVRRLSRRCNGSLCSFRRAAVRSIGR